MILDSKNFRMSVVIRMVCFYLAGTVWQQRKLLTGVPAAVGGASPRDIRWQSSLRIL
jgi:hypothetical protein